MRRISDERRVSFRVRVQDLYSPASIETMNKVVAAANAAYSKDSIGGSPVCGIMPEWFVHEWEDFVKLKPEAAAWDQRRIQSTMEALWLLDPEDLV